MIELEGRGLDILALGEGCPRHLRATPGGGVSTTPEGEFPAEGELNLDIQRAFPRGDLDSHISWPLPQSFSIPPLNILLPSAT